MSNMAPSTVPIQQESVQFNNPVSEASASAIGGVCNYLLNIQLPIGSIFPSMLTEPQLLAQLGSPSPSTWILADGRGVAGSQYQTVTGNTNVPDLRGIFVRGSNSGGSSAGTRADGNQNPDGTLNPGTYSADKFASHQHQVLAQNFIAINGGGQTGYLGPATAGTGLTGGNETAPKNVTVNYFIRIN